MKKGNDNNETEFLVKKAEYFLKKKTPLHVSLKTGEWYNGVIMKVSADFILLFENKIGEMPVFYMEIASMQPFHKKEEGE